MALSKEQKALRKRAKAAGLPLEASIEEIELAEAKAKEAPEKPAADASATTAAPSTPKPAKPKTRELKKVKATNEQVMAYQDQKILYGWDPKNGIATIWDV